MLFAEVLALLVLRAFTAVLILVEVSTEFGWMTSGEANILLRCMLHETYNRVQCNTEREYFSKTERFEGSSIEWNCQSKAT